MSQTVTQTDTVRRSIVSPEDQSATFIELFFDLIFVFSVTQVTGLLHEGFTLLSVSQAVLVFWLVWWAWTQFTWALNAGDTTHPWVELATLVATAVAFFMAIALPDAFHGRALWFAGAYVLVRSIGLILYIWVSWADQVQRMAVITFGLISLAGIVSALAGGFLGGSAQYWLWGGTILLDIIAANIGGQKEGWGLHPEHFAERHGLFTIIALGETLIVAGAGVAGETWTSGLIAVAVMAVLITCALWWSYFARTKHVLEEAMAKVRGAIQSAMARDVFSLLHFPMICGVIAYAYAIEEAVAHPGETMPLTGRLALALGIALFVGVMAVAVWRATRTWMTMRLGVLAITAVLIIAVPGVSPLITLGIAFVGVLCIVLLEERDASSEVR